jgi:hypothetical protein
MLSHDVFVVPLLLLGSISSTSFTTSFYSRRSQMRKKRQSSHQCLFALLGPTTIKASHKMLMKLTPGIFDLSNWIKWREKITHLILNSNKLLSVNFRTESYHRSNRCVWTIKSRLSDIFKANCRFCLVPKYEKINIDIYWPGDIQMCSLSILALNVKIKGLFFLFCYVDHNRSTNYKIDVKRDWLR